MIRRPHRSLVANPVLIGAVTGLVVLVAVYLSYNANNGLPFVPTRELVVQLDNGATVGADNEVREGGYRLGIVSEVRVARLSDGRVGAEAVLKLDKAAGALPVDSTFIVRPKGAIGGSKYFDVHRGRSRHTYVDHTVVPADRTTIPVELDEVLSTFDPPTRAGIRRGLRGMGDGLAGRGADLNRGFAELPGTLRVLRPVMANLADRRTTLAHTIQELGDAARIIAPVAPQAASAFGSAADTFDALASERYAFRQSIDEAGPTLRDGTRDLRAVRPFLRRTAALLGDAQATADELRRALPTVNDALALSAPPLRRAEPVGTDLDATVRALDDLARAPATGVALRGVRASIETLQPQLRFYGPHITVCNMMSMWFAFVGDILSTPSPAGTAQFGEPSFTSPADDDLGQMGANEFATGRGTKPGASRQDLHADVFPSAVADDGRANCAYQNGGYRYRGNPANNSSDEYYKRAVVGTISDDPRTGPTFKRFDRQGRGHGLGPARVPPGETYTRRPGGRAAPER